eukprot:s4238_g3.t1
MLVCGLSVSDRHGVHPTCRPKARAAAVGPQPFSGAGGGGALPTLPAIQNGKTPTLRHVPALARHTSAQALTRPWPRLPIVMMSALGLSFSCCLKLCCVHRHVVAANIAGLRRPTLLTVCSGGLTANAWVYGRPGASLLAPTESHCHQRSGKTWLPAWARRGLTRRRVLPFSEHLCPFNTETARSLEALHPKSALPAVTPLQDLPLAPEVVPELVARCLRSFPAETAPAPTGLRVQHLRDACVAGGTDVFLTQLAAVVSLVSQSMAPATIAPVLAGAGLAALPKPCGGVRPIAVGELLRRLVGKCLMTLVRDEARQYFWPSQVGVGVKGGAEKAGHTVRAWMQRNSSSCENTRAAVSSFSPAQT